MKILHCISCNDIQPLTRRWRTCVCKQSRGRYLSDGLNAEYSGPCRIIGINNTEWVTAKRGEWWVIDPNRRGCHIHRVDEVDPRLSTGVAGH